MKNEKRWSILIIILFIVLVVVLIFGIIRDRNLKKSNREDYNKWTETNSRSTNEKVNASDKPEVEDIIIDNVKGFNFYEKLKGKKDVKLLILGDGLANSQGRITEAGVWDKGLVSQIESTYGVKADLKSLAENGATAARGVEILNQNKNIIDYDYVITCFGQVDKNNVNVEEFKNNYKRIITELKSRNSKVIIMPILPSTINTESEYRNKIQELATEENLRVVDTRYAFNNSGVPFASLLNGGLPNDEGYEQYAKEVAKVIQEEMNK